MNEKKLRFSIIVLLVAVAVASFGCGGGSGANSAPGGDFITAVMPNSVSTQGEGGNAPDSSTGSTPGDGENAPAGSTQNAQTEQRDVIDLIQVDFQEEDFPLPWEPGIATGKILMFPGVSEEHGNTVITCPSSGLACIIYVGTDGSVKYRYSRGAPSFTLIPPGGFPAIPLPLATEAAQPPVLDLGVVLGVGSDAAPRADELTTGADRNGVSVSYGQVQDGIGAERVLEFMNRHVSLEDKIAHAGVGGAPGLETFPEPPTIRLAEGTSDLYTGFAARAVQLINSALPYEKRITLGTATLPTDTELDDIPEGEIFLKFGSLASGALGNTRLLSNYLVDPQTNEEKVQKALSALVTINEREMRKAEVFDPPPGVELDLSYKNRKQILEEYWRTKYLDSRVENSDKIIKWVNDEIFLSVVIHELMHALGFYHTDKTRNTKSIMHPTINEGQVNVYSPYLPTDSAVIIMSLNYTGATNEETTDEPALNVTAARPARKATTAQRVGNRNLGFLMTPKARTLPGQILFPLDRAALLAAYGRLQPGAQPEELTAENLGAWTDTSFHLRGDADFPGGQASFGVASGNGLIQPWAAGPTPWTNLVDNNDLSGSAAWNGALLGVTPSSETVAGDASLTVGLASLNGRIDFSNMEKWGVKEAPGAAGSGTTWGDGDLGYTIEVRGNTFIQTGGDDGKVTGAFFGVAHEAMGGVLERVDLAAGFGGKR